METHRLEVKNVALQLTDSEVVELVLAGELHLFEIIMRRYNQRLYRTIRSILRSDAASEEVLQETYVRAFFKLKDFSARGSFGGWLSRIAVHEAYAQRRRALREIGIGGSSAEERLGELPDKQSVPQDQFVMSRELNTVITEALDKLPQEQRTVFVLREVEQLSTEETAESLGISRENVKVRLHRAKQALQDILMSRFSGELKNIFEFGYSRCDRVVKAVFERIDAEMAD